MPHELDRRQAGVFVVTGATSGIGFAVARALLEAGRAVIGAGRTPARCAEATRRLSQGIGAPRLAFVAADLSIQGEVRRMADEIGRVLDAWREAGLAGLVNNAGTFTFWQTLTPEGFETQWAVNHLAPFLLTNLLLPRFRAEGGARIVTVSSGSHYGARLDWADIQRMRHYSPLQAYKQTKLANVLFTVELNRRLGESSQVRAFAADPGLVNTEMGMKVNSRLARWVWSMRRRSGISPEEAAAGIVWLLVNPEVVHSKEIYWKHGRPKAADPAGMEADAARRLWDLSEAMCGLVEEVQAA
jgi:NAD(P)-dependent dehydrogenase (short-subunit alcohol dehydrogenase family)